MVASAYWIRLGGYLPATEIAPHTAPTWETYADGGIGEVSFALALSTKSQHPLLRPGVKVEVMLGATPVATAEMTEPDRTSWEVSAFGLATSAKKVAALSAAGVFSRDVGLVLNNVVNLKQWWRATLPGPLAGPGVVYGDSEEPQMLDVLLSDYAAQIGYRWGVGANGRMYLRQDPTTPSLHIAPGAAAFGLADDDTANQLVVRYQPTGGGAFATTLWPTVAPVPVKHQPLDLTERGEMTLAQAQEVAAGVLALGKALPQWTNGVTLTGDQVTWNGEPASLPLVTAGQMVRASGMSAAYITQAPWLDVVIGKTRYTAGEDSIYLEPVNTAPRGLENVLGATG